MAPTRLSSVPKIMLPALPLLFVFLWSTGNIVTRVGVPYIEPFTFLAIRFSLAALFLLPFAVLGGALWPRTWREATHVVIAGLLAHGAYLSGVFVAIDVGVATGTVAVITGLQPLLTGAFMATMLGARIPPLRWLGLTLGFVGVGLVVWEKLGITGGLPIGFSAAGISLLGITAGTIYQKILCTKTDLRSAMAIQLAASAVATGLGALVFETRLMQWSGELVFAIAWQVVVLSAISFGILFHLYRIGEAIRTSSLFYLTAPTTAVMGYVLFGETFELIALVGIVIAVVGFALANR
jgi:drug/metabolite transporter (DMT)-like permease